jgi:ribosomal protein S18 acetylase RimI-like enzyme
MLHTVNYFPQGETANPVAVEWLTTFDAEAGRQAGDLLAAAYGAQFEQPRGQWPKGSVVRHVLGEPDQHEAFAAARAARMHEHAEDKGSRYWVVRGADGAFVSLAKVTPKANSLYVNNVLTRPEAQRRGLASCALHAALNSYGNRKNAAVTLDGFAGSPVNDWFVGLGFEPGRPLLRAFRLAKGLEMPQRRYRHPYLGGLLETLAQRTRPESR